MPWKVKTELLVKNIEHFTTKKQLLKKNYLSKFLVLHDLWNNIYELHRQVYLVLQLVGCTYFGKMTVFWLPALEGQPLSDITESTVPGLWNTYNICHGNTLYSIYRFLYQLVSVMGYILFKVGVIKLWGNFVKSQSKVHHIAYRSFFRYNPFTTVVWTNCEHSFNKYKDRKSMV